MAERAKVRSSVKESDPFAGYSKLGEAVFDPQFIHPPITDFINSLLRHRRAGDSPRQLAERILASSYQDAFSPETLSEWQSETNREMWFAMPARRSSESAIKYGLKDPTAAESQVEHFLELRGISYAEARNYLQKLVGAD